MLDVVSEVREDEAGWLVAERPAPPSAGRWGALCTVAVLAAARDPSWVPLLVAVAVLFSVRMGLCGLRPGWRVTLTQRGVTVARLTRVPSRPSEVGEGRVAQAEVLAWEDLAAVESDGARILLRRVDGATVALPPLPPAVAAELGSRIRELAAAFAAGAPPPDEVEARRRRLHAVLSRRERSDAG